MPGLRTSADQLVRTRRQTHGNRPAAAATRAIGRTTEDNIRGGVLFGAADAVDGMIRRICAEWPGPGATTGHRDRWPGDAGRPADDVDRGRQPRPDAARSSHRGRGAPAPPNDSAHRGTRPRLRWCPTCSTCDRRSGRSWRRIRRSAGCSRRACMCPPPRAWLGIAAWVVLLNGGTLALNSAFDRDEGDIAFLRDPPPPPTLSRPVRGGADGARSGAHLALPPTYRRLYLFCARSCRWRTRFRPFRLKAVAGMDWVDQHARVRHADADGGVGDQRPSAARPDGRGALVVHAALRRALSADAAVPDGRGPRARRPDAGACGSAPRNSLTVAVFCAGIAFGMLVDGGMANRLAGRRRSLRWAALAVAAAAWAVVLLPWYAHARAWSSHEHQRAMYHALAAWALTDIAVLLGVGHVARLVSPWPLPASPARFSPILRSLRRPAWRPRSSSTATTITPNRDSSCAVDHAGGDRRRSSSSSSRSSPRLLGGTVEHALTGIVVFIGAMITIFYPGTLTRPRTIDGIAGAAGIGLGATWVFLLLDAFLLQTLSRLHQSLASGRRRLDLVVPPGLVDGRHLSLVDGRLDPGQPGATRPARPPFPPAVVLVTDHRGGLRRRRGRDAFPAARPGTCRPSPSPFCRAWHWRIVVSALGARRRLKASRCHAALRGCCCAPPAGCSLRWCWSSRPRSARRSDWSSPHASSPNAALALTVALALIAAIVGLVLWVAVAAPQPGTAAHLRGHRSRASRVRSRRAAGPPRRRQAG